jgi:hypothetical protein
LNENVEILESVYRAGDKSVLPMLFHFTYLTAFYDDALLSSPDDFLDAMGRLSEVDQYGVAFGMSGGEFSALPKPRFEAIRALLTSIPDSSQSSSAAKICLRMLETNNASLFLNYFPAGTFTDRAADFMIHWFSRDLYSLGEQPLLPVALANDTVYRFTYLGAFSGPKSATLTVLHDGTGTIVMKEKGESRNGALQSESTAVSQEQVSQFMTRLQQADFWHIPAEEPSGGLDGAEWLLEGLQGGTYHLAVRWCPGLKNRPSGDAEFANAARFLFALAGHKIGPGC